MIWGWVLARPAQQSARSDISTMVKAEPMSRERAAAIFLVAFALPSSAHADNNLGNILQDGATNNAAITQTGTGNSAGGTNDLEQRGDNNRLILTQSGNDNTFGLTGAGLLQTGIAPQDSADSNSATIVQNSNGNSIGEIVQTTLPGTHLTTGNVLTITQDFGLNGGPSGNNTVASVHQTTTAGASANRATVTQTGSWNWVDAITQSTTSGEGDNELNIELRGSYNGLNGSSDGPVALGALAGSVGATPEQIIQSNDAAGGARNIAHLLIIGDYNSFGMTQLGVDNTVGQLTVTGFGNSVGTYQQGRGNQINPGDMVGNGNDLGVRQDGLDNVADVNIIADTVNTSANEVGIGQLGDNNRAGVTVHGDTNVIGISQRGNKHEATVNATGDGNVVLGMQVNSGATASIGNELAVTINGSGNNGLVAGAPQAFSGAAFDLAALAPAISRSNVVSPDASLLLAPHSSVVQLVPGALYQSGEDNDIVIDVGTVIASNGNLFAVMQQGNRNHVAATVNGVANQFVVLQMSDDDITVLQQTGDHNMAAISQ
jgi:hypothetical protein